ncbi:MAG: HAD hydrolase family protein [bacterium]|nr:HAD hydrolase family protein [bacterium]
MPYPEHLRDRLAAVRIAIFDVDGVLTDGTLGGGAAHSRRWNVKDGFGFKLARKVGLRIGLCSGNDHADIRERAERLKLDVMRLGRLDKDQAVREILAELKLEPEQAIFTGDDLFDLPGIRAAGLGAAPADAAPELLERVDWRLQTCGGRGVGREVIEGVLQARGEWRSVIAPFIGDMEQGD